MMPTWSIPLGAPPQVVAIGRNAHGFVPSDRYRLKDLWSLHLYGYDAEQSLNGQPVTIRPGTLGVTPPGVLMETRYVGISVHIYAHFRLAPGSERTVAAVVDTGVTYEALYRDLYEAVGVFARDPVWTSARVWNALWTAVALSDRPHPEERRTHRAVRQAGETIERTLNGPVSVAEIAREVGVTPSYLARLFQEAYDESITGYVRRRRMERASDLLQRSNLPIKMVASSVGFNDLQQFNKAVRAAFGVGPREWRARGQG